MIVRDGFLIIHIYMNNQKGFTLIELLVVVSIVGVLATIVLSSLSDAWDRTKEAAVKAGLSQMRAQSELEYLLQNNYSTVCDLAGITAIDDSDSALMFISLIEDTASNPGDAVCIDQDDLLQVTPPINMSIEVLQ